MKAGEYGDNAADYSGEEAAPAAPTRTEPPEPTAPRPAGVRARTAPPGASREPEDAPPAERRAAPLPRTHTSPPAKAAARAPRAVQDPLVVNILVSFVYFLMAI